jgi:hypothetical protein
VAKITALGPNGGQIDRELAVKAPVVPKLEGLILSPPELVGGNSATGTVALNTPAPSGGFTITLSSNQTYVQVPASVTVPEGSISTTFPITTSNVADDSLATIQAVDPNAVTKNRDLLVKAVKLLRLGLSPDSVVGGGTVTGTIILNAAAPTGGVVITLSSSEDFAQVPASVTVAAGSNTATFMIATTAVTERSKSLITGTDPNGNQKSENLTVKPTTTAMLTQLQSGHPLMHPSLLATTADRIRQPVSVYLS